MTAKFAYKETMIVGLSESWQTLFFLSSSHKVTFLHSFEGVSSAILIQIVFRLCLSNCISNRLFRFLLFTV